MKQNSTKGRGWRIAETAAACILFALACIILGVAYWVRVVYNISFQELLYTVVSPLDGSGMSVVISCLSVCVPELLLLAFFIFLAAALCFAEKRSSVIMTVQLFRRRFSFNFLRASRHLMLFLSIAGLFGSFMFADANLKILNYLEMRMNPTTIYEDLYADPAETEITAPQEKKNLIYIYMESMETTYASLNPSGQGTENCIPNLTALAQEHVSFSNSAQLGGWHAGFGSTWTMGALFTTTAGLPFAFPVSYNSMGLHQIFASGCTTMGDILEKEGYHNLFLCGSDIRFGGRDKYFEQHGSYDICDWVAAREEGYLPADYDDGWWGFEDEHLYEIAKDKLLKLAQEDQPFNFTMLTVDTHAISGHPCSLCRDDYGTVAENVIACADRQVTAFVEWCSQQDFYEDTVIVITGDHPRMDTDLVEGCEYYDRTVYNCFINCPVPDDSRQKNREYTAMDIFPTVLAAMGFQIEGDQLGLGVNLFSDTDTFAETMGFDAFDQELSKYSKFFVETFS